MNIETKHYSDGTSATGVAPLPDMSPRQDGMSLFDALMILARVHTQEADPDLEVFIVRMGARLEPITGQVEYVRAWNEVRRAIGMPSFRNT